MAKKEKKEKGEELDIDEEDQSKIQEDENLEKSSEDKEDSSKTEDEESEVEESEDEITKLNKTLEEKDEEIIELKSHIQRLQADFDNFRKQNDKQACIFRSPAHGKHPSWKLPWSTQTVRSSAG